MTVYTITNKAISDLSFLQDGDFIYDASLSQGFVVTNTALLIHEGVSLSYDQLAYGVFRDNIVSVTPDKIDRPVFKKDFFLSTTYAVTENSPIGSVVGILTKNIDVPTYTYSLTNYTDTFEIVGNELKTKGQIDYETITNYTLEIKIEDNVDDTRFWLETIHVDILDVSDNTTNIGTISSDILTEVFNVRFDTDASAIFNEIVSDTLPTLTEVFNVRFDTDASAIFNEIVSDTTPTLTEVFNVRFDTYLKK